MWSIRLDQRWPTHRPVPERIVNIPPETAYLPLRDGLSLWSENAYEPQAADAVSGYVSRPQGTLNHPRDDGPPDGLLDGLVAAPPSRASC